MGGGCTSQKDFSGCDYLSLAVSYGCVLNLFSLLEIGAVSEKTLRFWKFLWSGVLRPPHQCFFETFVVGRSFITTAVKKMA